jgi:hypothetical protein
MGASADQINITKPFFFKIITVLKGRGKACPLQA